MTCAPRAAQPVPPTCPSRAASPNCNPRASQAYRRCDHPAQGGCDAAARPEQGHESSSTEEVRLWLATCRTLLHPDRPAHTHPRTSCSAASQARAALAQRRADELSTGGASRSSSFSTAQPMARPGAGQRTRCSARRRRGMTTPCISRCRSMLGGRGSAPGMGLCGQTGG